MSFIKIIRMFRQKDSVFSAKKNHVLQKNRHIFSVGLAISGRKKADKNAERMDQKSGKRNHNGRNA